MRPGSVVALFWKPTDDAIEAVESLNVVAFRGIPGDIHYCWEERQMLFISVEELSRFGFKPGDFREQVTVDFSGLQSLEIGTQVMVGSVPFEVEQDCAPCAKLARHLAQEPEIFVKQTLKQRGMFLRPIGSGEIRIGDPITLGAS